MGLKISNKFVSIVAVAGAVSLLSAPVGLQAAGERQPAAGQERQQSPAAGQQQEQHKGSAQQLSQEEIRQVQQKLSEMGHDPGPVDGIWGPRTQAAVKEFQQQKDIQATGQLDQKTLSELGVDVQAKEEPGVMDRIREGLQRDDQPRQPTETPAEEQQRTGGGGNEGAGGGGGSDR